MYFQNLEKNNLFQFLQVQVLLKLVVFDVFNKHIGNWVIKAVPCSVKAENFWRKTINEYTKGSFNLEHTGKYDRAEFTFNNL